MFKRKSIIQKTVQVGGWTLISRCLGIVREILTVRYIGASALSDAFFTAWKIPNTLRKLFAEGALSAAFVPAIVKTMRSEGRDEIKGLMSLGFVVFEGMVLLLCMIGMIFAQPVISLIAPGFSQEQILAGAQFLRILMPFIFLISTSALLAGPLQAVGKFFAPAAGPIFLNICYIAGLIFCLMYQLPITALCWFIICGGIVQLGVHIIAYTRLNIGFGLCTRKDLKKFGYVLVRFIPCFLSMGVMEVGIFIDTSFASLLSKGSVSLLSYANRFMGIPLGVFGVALSTILFPYFSRVSTYAPKRLGFYLLEATKLVGWVTLPVAIAMMLLSQKIFITLFLSDKFSLAQAEQAGTILVVVLGGLFFFAVNKILLNVYYSLHHTVVPALIAVGSVCTNTFLNWLFIDYFQAAGLALATAIAACLQTLFLYGALHHYIELDLYLPNLFFFFVKYFAQLAAIGSLFIVIYQAIVFGLAWCAASFFITSFGFWLWVGPLCLLFMLTLYATRSWFGIRILFLEND
jgi:putative peptidoglycan lipid II flippase